MNCGPHRPPTPLQAAKGQKLRKGFATNARPSQAAITSSCRDAQRRAATGAAKSAGCRRTGAGDMSAIPPSLSELRGPRSKRDGKTPSVALHSVMNELPKRCCPSFGARRSGRWSQFRLGGEEWLGSGGRGRRGGGRESTRGEAPPPLETAPRSDSRGGERGDQDPFGSRKARLGGRRQGPIQGGCD